MTRTRVAGPRLTRLIPAAGPFSPPDIAGLTGWWDASDTASITASGGAVSQWSDKSGNANHLLQGTAGIQPTTGTRTINSLNALDFDGSNDSLLTLTNPFTGGNQWTLFVVIDLDARSGTSGRIVTTDPSTSDSSNASLGIPIYDPGSSYDSFYNSSGAATSSFSGTAAVLLTSKRNASSWTMRANGVDGTASGTTATTSGAMALYVMGHGVPNEYSDGLMGEVILYMAALSSSDISTVETYLNTKWAVF